jgi:hypothetical protein
MKLLIGITVYLLLLFMDNKCVTNGCVIDCKDKDCGSDGCNGSCGNCNDGSKCNGNKCFPKPPYYKGTVTVNGLLGSITDIYIYICYVTKRLQ